MQKFIISKAEAGRRLDQYLERLLPGAGRSFCYKMLRKKNITVNRSRAEGSTRLNEGDSVEMFFSPETFLKLSGGAEYGNEQNESGVSTNIDPTKEKANRRGTSLNFDEYTNAFNSLKGIKGKTPQIIYEDEDFIFADKPVGALSQKSDLSDISMNEWIIGYLISKEELSCEALKTFKPAFCNRLDRNTSGIMLGGKSLRGLQVLSELLREREVHKYYLARLEGRPDKRLPVTYDKFTDFMAVLRKNRSTNKVTVQEYKEPEFTGNSGEFIHTGVRLMEVNEKTMLTEVLLHTGKSHQIRAHMAYLGHPLVGDPKYGSGRGKDFQALRAYRVVFPIIKEFPNISGREFVAPETGEV